MSGKARTRRTASARTRVAKRERLMTDKESSELLESASQALAMAQGLELIGGRIAVRQARVEARARGVIVQLDADVRSSSRAHGRIIAKLQRIEAQYRYQPRHLS